MDCWGHGHGRGVIFEEGEGCRWRYYGRVSGKRLQTVDGLTVNRIHNSQKFDGN